ncbi:MAG: Trehalose utilization [candidate division BRC1 bacterium ADurb.BinA364]|nr:MAG: Trehalose utilization [candidate division BRC1 bacterium ADurb.BinA364]
MPARRFFRPIVALCLAVLPVAVAAAAPVGEAKETAMPDPIRVAVVTGGHAYDVIHFRRLFRELEGVDAYVQHLDDFCKTPPAVRDAYDAVVFYIMMIDGPTNDGPGWAGKKKEALERLGETNQGILILHHALLAYREWPVWREIVGLDPKTFKTFKHGATVKLHVEQPDHPIMRGLSDWEMIDETYEMGDCDADGSTVLLTTSQPDNMNTVAWVRQYKKSRVFCLESGHDNETWTDPNFRRLLLQGIQWCAGRI